MTRSQSSGIEGKSIESSIQNHEKIISHLRAAAKHLAEAPQVVHFDGPYKRVLDGTYAQPPLKQKN